MTCKANTDDRLNDMFVDAAYALSLTQAPGLSEREVHLWPFELRADSALLSECDRILSASERTCAERFAFERDKRRYIVAHGVLRHLLSLYCGVASDGIGFEHGAGGKPKMLLGGRSDASSAGAGSTVSFNLSHSHDRALVGICRGQEIGVDLEMVRPELDVLSLAKSCFFGTEIEAIRAADQDQQCQTFFRYWVAKEAVLKGEGVGLGYPLDGFEVKFMPADERAGYITSAETTQLRNDWTIFALQLADGWPAAVAARGTGWSVQVCPVRSAVLR